MAFFLKFNPFAFPFLYHFLLFSFHWSSFGDSLFSAQKFITLLSVSEVAILCKFGVQLRNYIKNDSLSSYFKNIVGDLKILYYNHSSNLFNKAAPFQKRGAYPPYTMPPESVTGNNFQANNFWGFINCANNR